MASFRDAKALAKAPAMPSDSGFFSTGAGSSDTYYSYGS